MPSPISAPYVYSALITTTDVYQEFPCPFGNLVTLQVTNASIYIGFGYGAGDSGSVQYPVNDEIFLPSFAGIVRRTDKVRVKSFKVATPAIIVLTVRDKNPE